jgi:hypothetical protein
VCRALRDVVIGCSDQQRTHGSRRAHASRRASVVVRRVSRDVRAA